MVYWIATTARVTIEWRIMIFFLRALSIQIPANSDIWLLSIKSAGPYTLYG